MSVSDRINRAARRIPACTVYIVVSLWAAWMFWLGASGQLGAEPVKALEHAYGERALQLLLMGLAITPLRRFGNINLLKYRRAIGLSAFFLVLAHLLVWAVLDVQAWSRVWADILKRPYITVGMLAFVLMIPLAITSNNRSIKKLGAKWRQLHKLTYPVAIIAGVHFIWLVKGFQVEPLLYMGAILLLLAVRVKFRPKRVAAI